MLTLKFLKFFIHIKLISTSRPCVQIYAFVVIIQTAIYALHILLFISHYTSIIKTQKINVTNSQAATSAMTITAKPQGLKPVAKGAAEVMRAFTLVPRAVMLMFSRQIAPEILL